MSCQRRRGQRVLIWRTVEVEDRRGNKIKRPSVFDKIEVRAAILPDRSSKAEVPGQQQINVYKMLVPVLPEEDVTLWSRVEWNGHMWDIVTPPAERNNGVRATRHWTLSIRERPSRDGGDG